MKPILIFAALLSANFATAHAAPRRATPLHFARGATSLSVRGHLSGSQRRFYSLKTRAGQHLRISVTPASKRGLQLVPLLKVTPPGGQYDGEKTANYATNSTRAGRYQIEIAANSMASNARNGAFELKISAR